MLSIIFQQEIFFRASVSPYLSHYSHVGIVTCSILWFIELPRVRYFFLLVFWTQITNRTLDYFQVKDYWETVDKFTVRDPFQTLNYDLILATIGINSKKEAGKAEREFAAYVTSAYALAKNKMTPLLLNDPLLCCIHITEA